MPINPHFDLGPPGLGLLATIGSIILIDIALSGDNALVIGAVASRLPRGLRFLAILWGGAGAIVLRIVLASVITLLLLVPLLQAAGGVVLMVIAIHLLMPQDEGPRFRARDRFLPAILTILAADVTMSLDNIIAIGALAKGNLAVLAIGLVFSMAVLFLASAVVARVIERLSILLDLASLVLAFTAANLVAADPLVGPHITPFFKQFGAGPFSGTLLLNAAFVLVVLLVDVGLRLRRSRRAAQALNAQEAASAVPRMASGVAARIHTDDVDLRTSVQLGADLNVGMNGAAAEGVYDATSGFDAPLVAPREAVGSRPLAAGGDGDDGMSAS
jgi:YjbE family integral membrane protein